MEINKNLFFTVVSQIKAYRNVVVLKDSTVDGCIDILYIPKISSGLPKCINKMTVSINGKDTDLFNDAPPGKLGDTLLVRLSPMKEILNGATSCVLEKGCLNGIKIKIDTDTVDYSIFEYITGLYDDLSSKIKNTDLTSLVMRQTDYTYVFSELSKFVSKDTSRGSMLGICFDFDKSEPGTINFVATDGRKMCRVEYGLQGQEGNGIYSIPPDYLFLPTSYFSSAQIKMSKETSCVLINTEDYKFESNFENIDGLFPNYPKVIPVITEKTQWFTLNSASFCAAIDSVKSLIGKRDALHLNAENPENLLITVGDNDTALQVEGTASRPMFISFYWDQLKPCLVDDRSFIKFYLNGSYLAIQASENKTVKGISMNVLKIFMPVYEDSLTTEDEFRIPKVKRETDTETE